MIRNDYILAAYALKKLTGQEHALLVGPKEIHVARHPLPVPQGDETAAAALLHRVSGMGGEHDLYLSYPPTEMCLGLAWRAKLSSVCSLTLDGSAYTRYWVGDQDCQGGGWRNTPQSVSASPPAPKWGSLDEVKRWWEQLLAKDLRLKQAVAHLITGRPEDIRIRGKLSTGLLKLQPVEGGVTPAVHENFMRIVYALVRLGWNNKTEDEDQRNRAMTFRPFGNNIAGILVDASNRIIAWGLNLKHVNPTFHAETMMIQYYLRRHDVSSLPTGCRVYTSLECCHMCAGYIATVGKNLQVYYGQKDPNIVGPNALARKVNGCRQFASTLPQVELLARKMDSKGAGIIDFLFDPSAARPIFTAALAGMRQEQHRRNQPDAVLQQGNLLIMELQDSGILHETLGAPLTVSL